MQGTAALPTSSSFSTDDPDSRLLANSMLEAMDVAIGRLLDDLHLATLNSDRTQITKLPSTHRHLPRVSRTAAGRAFQARSASRGS